MQHTQSAPAVQQGQPSQCQEGCWEAAAAPRQALATPSPLRLKDFNCMAISGAFARDEDICRSTSIHPHIYMLATATKKAIQIEAPK
jgi:hypothetical protein